MAKSLLTCSFIIALFFISLISYSHGQSNMTSSLSNDPISQSTIFNFVREIAPLTDDQNVSQIFDPEGVAVDAEDNVYVNDIGPNEVKKYDKDGTIITKWGSMSVGDDDEGKEDRRGLDTPLSHPHGNKIDENGNIYVTDQNNQRVVKFSNNGTFITSWGSQGEGNGEFIHPHGIDIDSKGYVYVSDRDLAKIQKFSNNGTFITSWGSQGEGNGEFNMPWDVAVDKNDNIYVPDYGNNRIQIFSDDGTFMREFGTEGQGQGQFNHPAVIAFDDFGNIYVTDSDNLRVQVFSYNGTFLTMFGTEGQGQGQFSKPESIAVDSQGRVYVADTSNNNVQLFEPM
jgi:sugar lactone lactonase YvrE